MNQRRILPISLLLGAMLLILVGLATAQGPSLSPNEQLGKLIFNDQNLSINNNQSCASCHDPAWGWTGPDSDTNAS